MRDRFRHVRKRPRVVISSLWGRAMKRWAPTSCLLQKNKSTTWKYFSDTEAFRATRCLYKVAMSPRSEERSFDKGWFTVFLLSRYKGQIWPTDIGDAQRFQGPPVQQSIRRQPEARLTSNQEGNVLMADFSGRRYKEGRFSKKWCSLTDPLQCEPENRGVVTEVAKA